MTNLEIAQSAKMLPIDEVCSRAGLAPTDLEPHGRYKGKLSAEGIQRLTSGDRTGKLILVTAITPTLAGEGKTTVTIGLTQGLNHIGRHAVSATREPALGPIFGNKGGACGGGYSQVLPMEEINLFFNGDFPAIAAAHNLLSALLDAHLHHGNHLGIDQSQVRWPRTVDMNDRALRTITTGLNAKTNGPVREAAYVITPASEVMAIICLSRSIPDLKERLGAIVAGVGFDRKPRTARELQASGSMAALLKDAIRPNLVQTVENGLAIVHGGPFGNIAHGCSSIIATECGLRLADFVVTEAGFASDLGGEKFLDIVCPQLGHGPDAIVLVVTVKALELHGEGDLILGLGNLSRHIAHLQHYGPPIIVAINKFANDSEAHHQQVLDFCRNKGIAAEIADPFAGGGPGCAALAEAVSFAAQQPSAFTPLYAPLDSFESKLNKIVRKAYGGDRVRLSPAAAKDLSWIEKNGYGNLPVCVAKTQYSLSDDPQKINAPEGFEITVRELRLSAGAGFIVAVCGDILLMPGLGKSPAALQIDVDDSGKITGLF